MNLADLQNNLLRLVKSTHPAPEIASGYVSEVAGSERLAVVQEIVHWWREVQIGRYCLLTSAMLKRRGIFAESVRRFISSFPLTPFIEELSPTFLEMVSTHPDPRVAALARFELALLRVKQGDPTCYVVEWDVDPNLLLYNLLNDYPLNDEEMQRNRFSTVISRDLPGQYEVLPIESPGRSTTPISR